MKKAAFLLALVFVFFALSACGSADIGSIITPEKEPELLTQYTVDDILGCWYGTDTNGERYHLYIYGDETAAGVEYRFSMNADNGDKSKSLFGNAQVVDVTLEDGSTATCCNLFANVAGGAYTDRAVWGFGELYDDGSFVYAEAQTVDENGTPLTELKILTERTFGREYFAPALSVDRKNGSVSGVWPTREDDDFTMLSLYGDGSFSLRQEEAMIYGVYTLSGDSLSLTAKTVEGEAYTEDNATVTATLNADNDLIMGEAVIHPVSGGAKATYKTAEADGYTLTLCESGIFYIYRGDSDDQVAGVYTEDGEGYVFYALSGSGYPQEELCIAEKLADGTLSFYFMSEGEDNKLLFTKQ